VRVARASPPSGSGPRTDVRTHGGWIGAIRRPPARKASPRPVARAKPPGAQSSDHRAAHEPAPSGDTGEAAAIRLRGRHGAPHHQLSLRRARERRLLRAKNRNLGRDFAHASQSSRQGGGRRLANRPNSRRSPRVRTAPVARSTRRAAAASFLQTTGPWVSIFGRAGRRRANSFRGAGLVSAGRRARVWGKANQGADRAQVVAVCAGRGRGQATGVRTDALGLRRLRRFPRGAGCAGADLRALNPRARRMPEAPAGVVRWAARHPLSILVRCHRS